MRPIANTLFRLSTLPPTPRDNQPARAVASAVSAALAVVCVTFLSGCSDPQAATDANFREVLEPVVRDAFCKTIPVERMSLTEKGETPPFPIMVPAQAFETGSRNDADSRKMLEAFARDGWLTRTESTAPARRLSRKEPLTPQALVTYAPTDKGKDRLRAVEAKTVNGMRPFPALCVARGEITEIVRWTDPADMFGQTISRVTYTYNGIDMMEDMPDDMRASISEPRERTVTVVRTNDGWRLM